MVQSNQYTLMGKNLEPIDSMEEKLFFLKEKPSIFHNKNKLMRASKNNLLEGKIALKKYNSVLANKITHLNSYITKFWSWHFFD